MSKTYVIADLHGRFDLFALALSKIEDHADGGTIVCLGDWIDRGPESYHITEHLIAFSACAPDGWKWKVLTGNHEDMMVQCLSGCEPMSWWFHNGGEATMASYRDTGATIHDHLKWFANLPLCYEDAHRFYVHAGVNPNVPLVEQDRYTMLWLYPEMPDEAVGGKHIVHGHVQDDKNPRLRKNVTNLDTFAWYTGRLVVGVFDDAIPGGPVDTIEIIGEPSARKVADDKYWRTAGPCLPTNKQPS